MNNLPFEVKVDDYHELDTIQKHLKLLVPDIQVKETGFKDGKYIGTVSLKPNRKTQVTAERPAESYSGN